MHLRFIKKTSVSWCLCLIAAFAIFLACREDAPVFAQIKSSSPAPADASMPWRLAADRVSYDQDTNLFTATGDVKIERGDNQLSAQVVRFNRETMEAEAEGEISLTAGDDFLTGDRVRINLETATGIIYNGTIFVQSKHFYIRGNEIRKTGKQTYTIDSGSLTTCEGDPPAWKITGRDLDVTLESYGSVKHATLWARQLPVAYVPYFLFPVKQRRQSGLLPPQLGYSNRNGAEYAQPFFWAINRSSDATFYLHYIKERGLKYALEYRWALSSESSGVLMADFLDDERIDDGIGDASDKWGYSRDNILRTNTDRYWFRGKADQQLPLEAQLKLDIDIVSDQDYLREFDSGYTGYDAAMDYFVSEYGRDLDDENDPVRRNSMNMSRIWSTASLDADMIWYDNVINRRQDLPDDTLQRLPRISFATLKQPFSRSPVFYELESDYTNFFREEGVTGQRVDVHPRLYLPVSFNRYVAFEPSAGFRQTAWYVDQEGMDPLTMDDAAYQHRETYDLGADLSSELAGVFDVNRWSIEKIRHTLIPELAYSYIPDTDQSEYPFFDETDRIENENRLTFSLTQLFTARTSAVSPEPLQAADPIYQYDQLCRILVEQPYNFNDDDPEGADPFEPLYFELDVTPVNLLTLHADAEWSHDVGDLITHNFYCRAASHSGDYLLVEHRYEKDVSQSVYFNFSKAVTDRIRLYGKYERNLDDGIDIEKGVGLVYTAQCWGVDVSMEDEEDDRRFGLMINLLGLGGLGKSL